MKGKKAKPIAIKRKKAFILFPDKIYFLEALKSIIQEIKTSDVQLFNRKKKIKNTA